MLYLADEYSTRVFPHAKKRRVRFPCVKRLSRQYNAVIKFHDFKGLRTVRLGLARRKTASGTPRPTEKPGSGQFFPANGVLTPFRPTLPEKKTSHGAVRQRNPPRQPRSRDAAFLP